MCIKFTIFQSWAQFWAKIYLVAQFSDLKNNFFQHIACDISKYAQNGHKSYNEYQIYHFLILSSILSQNIFCPYKVADDKIPIDRDEYYGLINFS